MQASTKANPSTIETSGSRAGRGVIGTVDHVGVTLKLELEVGHAEDGKLHSCVHDQHLMARGDLFENAMNVLGFLLAQDLRVRDDDDVAFFQPETLHVTDEFFFGSWHVDLTGA